jgi:hypothetical protein
VYEERNAIHHSSCPILFQRGPCIGRPDSPSDDQSGNRGDVALVYHWVRTNAQPGECGCFDLNGGGVSTSMQFTPRWSEVLEASGEQIGKAPSTGNSLTLASVAGGTRYRIPTSWRNRTRAPQFSGEVLIGGAHAGGGVAGAGNGNYALTSRVGGIVDFPLSTHFAIRGPNRLRSHKF